MTRYDVDTDDRLLDTHGFLMRINRKTDDMVVGFSKLQGQLAEKLPQLATRDEMGLMVMEKLEKHRESCDVAPKPSRSAAKTTGMVSGIAGVIYLLVDKLVSSL